MRKVLSLVLILALLLVCLTFNSVSAAVVNEDLPSRLINVVYDDSNSMLLNNSDAWCQAKYSLEVFAAMMQEKDTMNVYFMSDFEKKSSSAAASIPPTIRGITGSNSQSVLQGNVDKIHSTVTNTKGTPFLSIVKAYNDTASANGYDEKWLVVLTDGESFNNDETQKSLNDLFKDSTSKKTKIVYLAIGDKVVMPSQNTSRGVYVYQADVSAKSGEKGILSRVTTICEQIFQRPSIPTATSTNITFDIPVSEIIVFAQGASVSIGNISGASKTTVNAKMTSSDASIATTNPNYVGKITTASLNGQIVRFLPSSGSYISEGSYDISINADDFIVYYKPCLDIKLNLKNAQGKIVTESIVPVGHYSIEYWLTYPNGHEKAGQEVRTSLFSAAYTATLSNAGTDKELTSSEFDLSGGDALVNVEARFLKFNTQTRSLRLVVENALTLTGKTAESSYKLSELDEYSDQIDISVFKNGSEELTQKEWDSISELKITTEKNVDFTIRKSDTIGKLIGSFGYKGLPEETSTGDIPYTVTLTSVIDSAPVSGTYNGTVTITDNTDEVALSFSSDNESYTLSTMEEQSTPIVVKALLDGKELTDAQIDELIAGQNFITTKDKVDFTVEKGSEPSTFSIYPKFKDGDMYKTKIGNIDFKLNGAVNAFGKQITGEGTASAVIEDDVPSAKRFAEWLKRNLWWLLLLLILIILGIGYLPPIKKYFPRSMCRTPVIVQTINRTRRKVTEKGDFKKNFWSTFFPYVPQTGILRFASVGVSVPKMKLRSAGGGAILVMNTAAYAGRSNISFDGETVPKDTKKPVRIGAGSELRVTDAQFVSLCTPNMKEY